jgi:hypothetical protein
LFTDDEEPSVSSEDVYKFEERTDFEMDVVLGIRILWKGEAGGKHLVDDNGSDLSVEKGDDTEVCD